MKYLVFILGFFSSQSFAGTPYKFHYGDHVIVHSSAWKKPCFDDEFMNYCGKVGIVIAVYDSGPYCTHSYTVMFKFKGLQDQTDYFCEVHLKRVR